jgi:hypothetical protein
MLMNTRTAISLEVLLLNVSIFPAQIRSFNMTLLCLCTLSVLVLFLQSSADVAWWWWVSQIELTIFVRVSTFHGRIFVGWLLLKPNIPEQDNVARGVWIMCTFSSDIKIEIFWVKL